VDFLRAAAKELAERQLELRRAEREFHQVRLEAEDLPKPEQAALKAGLKEGERFLEHDKPAEVLEAMGVPALAALRGPKAGAAGGSARWRCGRWKPTGRRTRCRRS